MPLFDHFHSPLRELRPWGSFHATWCTCLANHLNESVLPDGFIAMEQVTPGPAVEIDVGTFSDTDAGGGVATLPRTLYRPASPPLVAPFTFAPGRGVEIREDGAMELVAAIELVSPANKDRAAKRRLFVSKIARFLAQGAGVVVVDTVTNRSANLHNELAAFLRLRAPFRIAPESGLYAVAYRPLNLEAGAQIEMWPFPLAIGQPLPTVPLSLTPEDCAALDLEVSYNQACEWRRIAEAAGPA